MKTLAILTLLAISSLIIISCSETEEDNTPNIQIKMSATDMLINETLKDKPDVPLGDFVDEVKITDIRILVSRIIFHLLDNDQGKDKVLKEAPVIFHVNPALSNIIMVEGRLPEGTYDKIKFEIHRFSENEANDYKDDPVFADFTSSDRFTVIIDGTLMDNGNERQFTFYSNVTANYSLDFGSPILIANNTLEDITLQFDPDLIFRSGNLILDPRDPDNENEISTDIKIAFKVLQY